MVGADDSKFSGLDLATLIREKYGRSYDVQLIKKVITILTFLLLNNVKLLLTSVSTIRISIF
jgi:hypothetical protein